MQPTWILASDNAGKLGEFQRLIGDGALGVTLIRQGDLGIKSAKEDGLSFVENALLKARHASASGHLPALADDSGLCVPLLGNAPGVHSARYAHPRASDRENNAKLLNELTPHFEQGAIVEAFFVCVLVFVRHAHDPLPLIAQGLWRGRVANAPKGEGGFGYDPLFFVPELGKTAAELCPDQKNVLSHRGIAARSFVQQWQAINAAAAT